MCMTDDVVTAQGWVAEHSVAMMLLATARAGSRPAPPALIRKCIAVHLMTPGIRTDSVMHSALSELEALWQEGGLRMVFARLQEHCGRLATVLPEDSHRQLVAQMLQVSAAVTTGPEAAARVRAFPYAAARVWKLDDVAASIMDEAS